MTRRDIAPWPCLPCSAPLCPERIHLSSCTLTALTGRDTSSSGPSGGRCLAEEHFLFSPAVREALKSGRARRVPPPNQRQHPSMP